MSTTIDQQSRRSEAANLLDDLDENGVQLRVDNNVVKWRAPKGNMTLALIREVKRLDAELKELFFLRADPRTEQA